MAAAGVTVGLAAPGAPLPEAGFAFDDGGASALLAAMALERHGWRGHFFVVSDLVGKPGFERLRRLRARRF